MNKKKVLILVIILGVVIFAAFKIFDKPKEFQVEEVMFDRGGVEN
ncbi:MAG: hypothetical protein RLY43_2562 [Bacteroidota bacterium]|jgi:predicted negative regulator of RcsB-dependent stress response